MGMRRCLVWIWELEIFRSSEISDCYDIRRPKGHPRQTKIYSCTLFFSHLLLLPPCLNSPARGVSSTHKADIINLLHIAGSDASSSLGRLRNFCHCWGYPIDSHYGVPPEPYRHVSKLVFFTCRKWAFSADKTTPEEVTGAFSRVGVGLNRDIGGKDIAIIFMFIALFRLEWPGCLRWT